MDEKSYMAYLASIDKRFERLYNTFINELAKVGITIDALPQDKLFTFEDYPQLQDKVNDILKKYQNTFFDIVKEGISRAVITSFSTTTMQLGKHSAFSERAIASWRNEVKDAFLTSRLNSKYGLSLSQKVWNYSQQAKSEFEAGMSEVISQGISKGISAEELGRNLRSMLKRPDEVYRRYHEKKVINGKKQDVINWYRKVVDEKGNTHFVKGDMELVGRGQYRSSRQNALRLAATEINMSYHYANHSRWIKEPYVIGVRITLSGNHSPRHGKEFYDMCDELQGDYPKTFLFKGWHPRCLCSATAITMSDKEWQKIENLPKAKYEKYVSPNTIKEMPQSYKDFIAKNEDYLIRSIERGKQPYWIRDNYVDGDLRKGRTFGQLQPLTKKAEKEANAEHRRMILQQAKERQELRTTKQIDSIQTRWNERLLKNSGRYSDVEALRAQIQEYGMMPNALNHALRLPYSTSNALIARLDSVSENYKSILNEIIKEIKHNKQVLQIIKTESKKLGARGKAIYKEAEELMQTSKAEMGDRIFRNKYEPLKIKIIKLEHHRKEVQSRWQERKNSTATNETEQQRSQNSELTRLLELTKGKPMTHEEANENRSNPFYVRKGYADYDRGYTVNCQSCVVAYEMRRRGWDVNAFKNTEREGNMPHFLSHDTVKIWVDKNGDPLKRDSRISVSGSRAKKKWASKIEEEMTDVGRYHVTVVWKGGRSGHIFTAERLKDGSVRYYDPQVGKNIELMDYLKNASTVYPVKLYRVDDKAVNLDMIHYIVRSQKNTKR